MLKIGHAVNTLVATLLVVPAVTLQSRESAGLEQALKDTVRALEYLTGLTAKPAHDTTPLADIARHVTELPLSDARERDDLLVRVRADVSRLQMVYDELAKLPPGAGEPGVVPQITTGLSSASHTSPTSAIGSPTNAATHAIASAPAREEAGFSADPLRQGQALYRAGRYEECIRWLEARRADPNAEYWIARSLEKLERIDSAIESYRKVADDKNAGPLAVRAKNDLEFLEWRRTFGSKLGEAQSNAVTGGSGSRKP